MRITVRAAFYIKKETHPSLCPSIVKETTHTETLQRLCEKMATPAAPLTPTTTVRPPDPPPHPTASSTTLPDPPQFIAVDGVYNFRDIGGYAIASSPMKSVRRHFVYRSADPSLASAPGRAALRELRVTRVFDMRSRSEIEKARAKAPPLVMDGVEVVYVPVFEHRVSFSFCVAVFWSGSGWMVYLRKLAVCALWHLYVFSLFF